MGAGAGRPAVAELAEILADAVADGALVATGGGELQRKPMAAVRALAGLGRRELRLATMLGSADVEVLLGSGCLAEVHSAGVALLGLAPRWRAARQEGSPRVIVTYERKIDADPARAAISRLWIDDVVEAHGGARPTSLDPDYDVDAAGLKEL